MTASADDGAGPPGARDLAALRRIVRRHASVARPLRARPPDGPFGSWLGAVKVGGAGEDWPSHDGRPMAPLVQLDLRDAPFVPSSLDGIAVLTVFLGTDGDRWVIPDGPNGDGWLVRAHGSADDLVAVQTPASAGFLRPRALTWRRVEDFPAYEELVGLVDSDVLDGLIGDREPEDAVGETADGTKIGGWPSLLQAEIIWRGAADATFAFQVDSDGSVGLNLWDGGVLHIGRTADGDWVAEAQLL